MYCLRESEVVLRRLEGAVLWGGKHLLQRTQSSFTSTESCLMGPPFPFGPV